MSGPGGMPKRSGSEEQTSWADAAPPPRVLPVSGLYLQGHIPLSGTSEVSGPQQVGGGGDSATLGSPEAP